MVGFVRMFVKEFGLKGIIVNGIMFGIIKIDRMIWLVKDRVQREGKIVEEVFQEYVKLIFFGRLGELEEIGYFVVFLVSDFGGYINGFMILVDGGRFNLVF